MRYRIAVVDDKPNVIATVCKDLIYSGKAEIVFTADNGAEFLEKLHSLPPNKHPQVVLMDTEMPVMNGVEAVRAARRLYSHIQYIMLTVFENAQAIFEAREAGAYGYVEKTERPEVIVKVIEEAVCELAVSDEG